MVKLKTNNRGKQKPSSWQARGLQEKASVKSTLLELHFSGTQMLGKTKKVGRELRERERGFHYFLQCDIFSRPSLEPCGWLPVVCSSLARSKSFSRFHNIHFHLPHCGKIYNLNRKKWPVLPGLPTTGALCVSSVAEKLSFLFLCLSRLFS